MIQTIENYNDLLTEEEKKICESLMNLINKYLYNSESKIWHGHPVWFINNNPIVGYSKQKSGIVLLFWSGQSFDELELQNVGKFKAASKIYNSFIEININDLNRWLQKSITIQWDYKNIVKRKGVLELLK